MELMISHLGSRLGMAMASPPCRNLSLEDFNADGLGVSAGPTISL